MSARRRANLLLIVTDQQRAAMHWPDEPGWLRELTPTDHELARTGLTFADAICSSCMCSPSRATLFTGLYPTQHRVTLTLTEAGARPDPRNAPAVFGTFAKSIRSGSVPRGKTARAFARGALRIGANSGEAEPTLDPATPNLARLLAGAGYTVGFKGKWHLTKPLHGEWSRDDADLLERDYGFAGWEPPDAGENLDPEHFGGGNAGSSGMGFDEDFTRQAEAFIATAAEPWALIVSLVNPHDVLGYPASYERGGYRAEEFRDLEVPLPATLEEDLSNKPYPHSLMKLGQQSYIGPLRGRRAELDYLSFYAHLHRVVDAKIGRIVGALGDAGDARSLRSRTVVVRTADHGEMGLAHGGLRQKMFNAYEETLRVPLVVSNPVLFPRAAETRAPAGLVDLVPTLATLLGLGADGFAGADLTPVLARHADAPDEALEAAGVDLAAAARHPEPRDSVQDASAFVYEDHKAGTAFENVVPQPNRIRALREPRWKYAAYVDPAGAAAPQYELYDLDADPIERHNLVDRTTGAVLDRRHEAERERLDALLHDRMQGVGAFMSGR
ncbi:MAG TPA: sulfatase-like hydrolase/transferase [Thermoleophilaceae bacterium]|jgi:arylsulfatase A-like enzyme